MQRIIFLALITLLATTACNKNISDRTASLPSLQPANQDLNAGSWKLIFLSRPDSFAVATPAATTSPLYVADLNEIKAYQANLSSDQASKIKYWSAGGVLRWNEIMRSLMSKYNLPPYQNPDGTYPIPNAANPFAYPLFPFTNPPYAARAYGYVSAAQYDALVACWSYKNKFKRPAPYLVDSTVKALAGKSTLPSYPSEGAVLAGVTAELMQLFFPGEIANIQQKLEEQELSLIASGAATRSDVTAEKHWAARLRRSLSPAEGVTMRARLSALPPTGIILSPLHRRRARYRGSVSKRRQDRPCCLFLER